MKMIESREDVNWLVVAYSDFPCNKYNRKSCEMLNRLTRKLLLGLMSTVLKKMSISGRGIAPVKKHELFCRFYLKLGQFCTDILTSFYCLSIWLYIWRDLFVFSVCKVWMSHAVVWIFSSFCWNTFTITNLQICHDICAMM